jgi:lycopene cyclase domain-containing protein
MINIKQTEYLITLIISSFLPLLLGIFHPNSPFKGNFKNLFFCIFGVSIPWILWDFWATYRGHWSFSDEFTLGFKVFNLPIEEVAFFWIIPYCCLFVWALIRDSKNFLDLYQKFLGKK